MCEARLELDSLGKSSGNLISNPQVLVAREGGETENCMETGPSSCWWRCRFGAGSSSRRRVMEGRTEGAIELIAAIFRLAVTDYLGQSYSFDDWTPSRRVTSRHRSEAALFLCGPWARYLADLIGLEASAVWREVRRLDFSDCRSDGSASAA